MIDGSLKRWLWLASALSCGCAGATRTTVANVVNEGRDNELAAVAKYKGERLAVSGTVAAVGVRKVERLVAHRSSSGIVGGTRNVPYPYVILKDTQRPSSDQVVCYFAPQEAEEVSHVQQGSLLTLMGTFQEYSRGEQGLDLVLKQCELE